MAKEKTNFVVYRGKKLALGCGVCKHGEEILKGSSSRCVRCLIGSKNSFELDSKYKNATVGEHEREVGVTYEDVPV